MIAKEFHLKIRKCLFYLPHVLWKNVVLPISPKRASSIQGILLPHDNNWGTYHAAKYFTAVVKDTYQRKISSVWVMAWRLINANPSLNAAVIYIHFSSWKYPLYLSEPGYLDYCEFVINLISDAKYYFVWLVLCLWNIHLTHVHSYSRCHSLSWFMRGSLHCLKINYLCN